MKKILLPALFILLLGGCTHKHKKPIGVADQPTTMIDPSVVNPVPSPSAGPITITATQPANQIVIAAIFSGPNTSQTVTVRSGSTTLASFSNAPGGNTASQIVPGPGKGVTYTLNALVGTKPYVAVLDVPNVANEPDIATMYSDASGDSVTVFVTDLGTP